MHGPPMSLSGDGIIEASLLEPMGEECKTSPILEEEAIFLGEEPELLEAPEAAAFLPECLEIPGPTEPTKQINDPTTPALPSTTPQPYSHPSQKAKKPWRETEAKPNHTGKWVHSYVQRNEWVPNWWKEFQSLLCTKDKCFRNVQVKGQVCQQAMTFRLSAAQLERMADGSLCPALVCWGKRTIFPQKTSKESGMTEWCKVKKQWCWQWPFRGVPSDLECLGPRGALQSSKELHRCFTPLLEMGNLLDLKMLDMVRKDPMTPAPVGRVSLPRPRAQEPIGVPVPNEPTTLESEEAAHPEELALVQRRRPSVPSGFTLSWVDKSDPSP